MAAVFKKIFNRLSFLIGPDIFSATKNGSLDRVNVILAQNPELISAKDKDGKTPLHYAASRGVKDLVEILVTSGADINLCDNQGETALHSAVQRGKKDVVEFLISKGAELNAKDNIKITPLLIAVTLGFKPIAESLVKNGAEVNATFIDGSTPLHFAALGGYRDMSEFLICEGTEINAKDDSGKTALNIAIREYFRGCFAPLYLSSHNEVITSLIIMGAEINTKNNEGETILHIIAHEYLGSSGLSHRSLPTVFGPTLCGTDAAFFTKTKAKIKDHLGKEINPGIFGFIDRRCPRCPKDIVEFLIANGADINLKNNQGKTAIDIAKEDKHEEFAQLLSKHEWEKKTEQMGDRIENSWDSLIQEYEKGSEED